MSNSISSSLSLAPRLASTANTAAARKPLGSYELNTREFGPVAANAIGMAQAAGHGVSTICTLSREGLAELGEAAQDLVDEVVDGVSDAAQAVSDTVSSAASAVGDAASSVASYAALGALAGAALINELA